MLEGQGVAYIVWRHLPLPLPKNNIWAGFIYGVPPVANERVILDVVATNKANYETGILKLVINVTSLANVAGFENTINSVRLKIDNLNLVNN